MTNLPFLKKNKLPRIATEPREEKLINASASDHLEAHCMQELMDSLENKDVMKFRSALEALLMNMFEDQEEPEDAA